MALHQFLADPSVGGGTVVPEPPKRTTSWADATDDIDTGGEDCECMAPQVSQHLSTETNPSTCYIHECLLSPFRYLNSMG